MKVNHSVDHKTIRILLAALELELGELAQHMGYDEGYVANVLNGSVEARPAFRRAFGETIGSLVLGTYHPLGRECYPPEPLAALVEKRAAEAPSRSEFWRELGTSAQAIRSRTSLGPVFVDRVCCALGVHPSSVYGRDFDVQEAS